MSSVISYEYSMSTVLRPVGWSNTMENNLEFAFVENGDSLDIFSGMFGAEFSRSML